MNPVIQRQTGGNKEHSNPNQRKGPIHHIRNDHFAQLILKKLAQLTSSLRDLIKKNAHFKWEEQHQTALNKRKEELCPTQAQSLSFNATRDKKDWLHGSDR